MSETSQMPKLGAYFYPHTDYCPPTHSRRARLAQALGMDALNAVNDLTLAATAEPLFDGHDQPRRYQLGRETFWDDSHTSTVASHIALAQQYGLSYFIFNTYVGQRDGQNVNELREPANRVRQMAKSPSGLLGFQYAKMLTLHSPRAILPIPRGKPGFYDSFVEPSRQYDITPGTAQYAIDNCIGDWQTRAYLRIGIRPYLSVLMPPLPPYSPTANIRTLRTFVGDLHQRSAEYGEIPYIAGVIRDTPDVAIWAKCGVDAITQYSHLTDPTPGVPPVQDYGTLVSKRIAEWEDLGETSQQWGIPFLPSPSVGWDCSPRGVRGHSLDEVAGIHPFTPIVTGNTPEDFGRMLHAAIKYTKVNSAPSERLTTIFAWQEPGEGSMLIPRVGLDGARDTSYLEMIQSVVGLQSDPPR